MAPIGRGDRIFVPVAVGHGAFPGERLITLDTLSGPISGFIREEHIHDRNGTTFIEADVIGADSNSITVNLRGSFFTTTGRADISPKSDYLLAA